MAATPPTLEAYRYTVRAQASLVCWCVHCVRWHWHGTGPAPGSGDGHRLAHCLQDASPYCRGGYYLREVGPITTAEMRQTERRAKHARQEEARALRQSRRRAAL
jgi:hypothetical protein